MGARKCLQHRSIRFLALPHSGAHKRSNSAYNRADITRLQRFRQTGEASLHLSRRSDESSPAPQRILLRVSVTERRGRSRQARSSGGASNLQNEPGLPPSHRPSVFGCIQKPTFTLTDSYTILLRSFSYASSLPFISHPPWTHMSNR